MCKLVVIWVAGAYHPQEQLLSIASRSYDALQEMHEHAPAESDFLCRCESAAIMLLDVWPAVCFVTDPRVLVRLGRDQCCTVCPSMEPSGVPVLTLGACLASFERVASCTFPTIRNGCIAIS